MSNNEPSELDIALNSLQVELIDELRRKIADGEATAGDLSAARGLLKDNFVVQDPSKNVVDEVDPLDNLMSILAPVDPEINTSRLN